MVKNKQIVSYQFCMKLNKSAIKTYDSLTKAHGDDTLSRTLAFKWHKLSEGWENVESEPCSERPILSTNDKYVEVAYAV